MNGRRVNRIFVLLLSALVWSCSEKDAPSSPDKPAALRFYGEFDEQFTRNADGTITVDTTWYPIPKFQFIDQNGSPVTQKDILGKIVVADFFFTTCKSICPIMSSQMSRLQTLTEKEGLSQEIIFLSHSVDPLNDRPDTLSQYASRLGANLQNWKFLTVDTVNFDASYVYDLAKDGYQLTAFPSDTAQGGFFHTDQVALLDRSLRIRGYYDGTSTSAVDKLFEDIKILVNDTTSHR
ncbi:MAG: hypothetical protein RL220_301 [Bacteroidota bacterium]